MQSTETDNELINRVLNGETGQFNALVKRHQRFVFTLALRFTRSREDAEEVAQDCFVKAYRALGTYKQTSKFSTWLYTITYTTGMTFLRKKKLNTSSLDDEGGWIQVENQVSDYHADAVEKKFSHAYLNMAIDMLSPDDAAIITMFYKGEQSLEEIALVLNMESNNIKVKLHRARQRLKEKLQFLLKEEVNELV